MTKDLDSEAGFQQLSQQWCGRDDLFKVVQNQEPLLVELGHLEQFQYRLRAALHESQTVSNGRYDQIGIADGCEGDHMNPISKVVHQFPSHLEREACFAYTCRAGEGDQAHVWAQEQLVDRLHLLFATDQGREWHRETGKPWLRAGRFVRPLCFCDSLSMRPRLRGSFSGQSRSCSQARHVERALPYSLACQHNCHRLQPLEREFLRLTQIDPVQFAVPRAIGAPVRSAAPVACSLFVRGEEALLTTKGKGRGASGARYTSRGSSPRSARETRPAGR